MQTKTYIARESFIWKGGAIVNVNDELELTDYESKQLLFQSRVVLKPVPEPVEETSGEAETATARRTRTK